MTAAPLSAAGDVAPPARPPARRSWPRRHKFASSVIALVTLMLAVRLAWGWYVAGQLTAELQALRQRGEPTAVRDFTFEPIPATENAWNAYAVAIAALKGGADSPRLSGLEYPPYPPHGTKWEELAAASEKAHGPVFANARRARRLEQAQIPLLDWNSTRRLASTLGDGAQYSHLRGDDAEAVERLLDTLHLARSIRQDPTLNSQFTGIGVGAVATDATQQIVPTVKLDASAGGTPATPTQLRALIAALLDERQTREWAAAALRRERVTVLDALDQRAANTWSITPLADRTAIRWLRDFEALLNAAAHDHAGPARQLVDEASGRQWSSVAPPGLAADRGLTPRYSRWFEDDDPLNLSRFLEQHYRVSAERRATAVIVAANLYRHDHGRWPDDAAALVPNYLDALPADPFRPDGSPIGYILLRGALPDGGDRPMVYFELGEATEGVIDTEPMYSWQTDPRYRLGARERRQVRQYRDASYWLPKTRRFDEEQKRIAADQEEREEGNQRLQEAVDDQPSKPDAPGDDADDDDAAGDPAEQ